MGYTPKASRACFTDIDFHLADREIPCVGKFN